MKFFEKKSNLLKTGIAAVVLTIAVANYANLNGNVKVPSLITVSDAKADVNCYSASSSCYIGTTGDGVPHYVTNAEL